MAQYIDKDALVAEIEKRIKEHHSGYLVCLKDILSFINTLEVKEVDLEKESLTWKDIPKIFTISERLKTSWWFMDMTKDIGTQVFWEEVLNRFKAQKGEGVCHVYLTSNQKIGIANIAVLSVTKENQNQ